MALRKYDTGIRLDELTDEHIQQIGRIYRAAGLPCDDRFLNGPPSTADLIRDEIRRFGEAERRPVVQRDIGKFYFETDAAGYVHVRPAVWNPSNRSGKRARDSEYALEQFGKSLGAEFK